MSWTVLHAPEGAKSEVRIHMDTILMKDPKNALAIFFWGGFGEWGLKK